MWFRGVPEVPSMIKDSRYLEATNPLEAKASAVTLKPHLFLLFRYRGRNPWGEQMPAELESCLGVTAAAPHQQVGTAEAASGLRHLGFLGEQPH